MAKIVGIHGIGQQFLGDKVIHKTWWPALLSGLHLAGGDLAQESDLACAFYGHLFRKEGTLSTGGSYQQSDMGQEEKELLELLWQEAATVEPDKIPSPEEYPDSQSLVRYPQAVQRALNALSKSKYFANISQHLMVGDLKQVVRYMNDELVHEAVLDTVANCIQDDTRVVIGHSLGSVVAYEALSRNSVNVMSFISIGSPLGIRNLIFDRLTPPPDESKNGQWPGNITYWTNIADKGDIVALQRELSPLFGRCVKDILVYNGSDAHHGERYLSTIEVGRAILEGL
ncbi:hypothetical protein LC612_38030 [Nostoc sp. CHAB 5834]|nr:hypothetical protein [Nostoc sp. CHAB 5834]